MHHLYPLAKGDPLCPLGFHPQVRWPTRCKRCFRDYKEHGGVRKKEDDFTVSTPSLSTWNTPSSRSRDEDNGAEVEKVGRGWASSSNLSTIDTPKKDAFSTGFTRTSASWTSTPDLGANETESTNAVTVSLKLPKRRLTGPLPSIDTGQNHTTDTVTLRRPSPSPPPVPAPAQAQITISKNDSLAERVRKMQLIKSQNSFEKESSIEKERERRSLSRSKEAYHEEKPARPKEDRSSTKDDVNFMMQVKNSRNSSASSKPPVRGGPSRDRDDSDDDTSTAGTVTTETTLVDANVKEYQEQIESLKQEVDTLKKRCERVEKEKSDILLRRLANIDSVNKYTTGRSSEVLKLQQKVNELTSQNEDLKDEKKHLSLRVREIESELESRPSIEAQTRQIEQLRAKLLAAETLCEELMDENEDMKKELRDLEEEIEEMQDNFREDQADEYSSLRRELEQTIKNCRVLSFKLKKTERKADQLEQEKAEHEKKLLEIVGGQDGLQRENRIKELEQEVARSTEVALRLQRELSEANAKLAAASGTPPANLKKNQLTDGKVSRSSLTRGGSQEDPAQLLRDLQDSLEREADLREQLRNAEEEANNLRKTASRVEDDNESLLLQLKKMATKARSRKLSPTPPSNKLSVDNNEKDAKTDEEDPAELRILLELNEQETTVLRKKVEEMEQEKDSLKKQVKELTDKIANQPKNNSTVTLRRATNAKSNNLAEEKVKVLEDEIAELRKKLIEKERDCERLHAELSLSKKPKASLIKSKSLDGDQQNVDLKRQLQVIEQEANVLRAKTQSLEADNEKLQLENKKLQLLKNTKTLKSDKSVEQNAAKITQLENELKEALAKLKEFENNKDDKTEKKVRFGGEINSKKDADALKAKQEELDKLKLNFTKLEKEKAQLQVSLRVLKEEALKSFRPRVPKKPTDLTTKLQMKRMVEDLESEIGEMYVIMKNAGLSGTEINTRAQMEKDIEEIRSKLSKNDSEFTNEKNRLQTEIAKLKDLNAKLESDKTEINGKLKTLEKDNSSIAGQIKTLQEEKKGLETQVSKLNSELKNATSLQTTMSDCMKKIEELKNEIDVKDKEIDKLKKQVENVNKLEQDKQKLLKEVGDKTKKITDLEKKFKEAEDKCKRVEKQLTLRKDKVAKLEKELSQEKEQAEVLANSQRRISVDFTSEKDQMQTKLIKTESKLITLETELKEMKSDYESKITNLESTISAKDIHIKQLEDALRDTSNQKYDEAISSVEMAQMQDKLERTTKELEEKQEELTNAKRELESTEKELSVIKTEMIQLKSSISKLESEKKEHENKLQAEKKESSYWESKASELETDLQAERKKLDRMRKAHDVDIKNKEAELATLKGKLKVLEQSSGAGAKKISDLKQEYEETVKKLEHSLAVEKAEYEELTGKYEILEEEHVVTKARLTVEKEQAQGELIHAQKELASALAEIKTLQDNYDTQSSAWTKEKTELQNSISSLQDRLCGGGWEVERARLNAKLEQRERELRTVNDQRDVLEHHHDQAKKELEEARKKLEDYERVSKVQRTLTTENAELERELSSLNTRLEQADVARKNELAEMKLRYEGQMNTMRDELKSLHNQVSRFRRERDNYKQMLDAAQKTMTEMKNGDKNARTARLSISSTDEEEYRNKVATLEQQTACLEDELCEARLLASKLNTELISERSAAEVRFAEMQSRLNEYEEERLLTSGRARVAGLATRMELAWHKERDEQQRLLQETSTLARDLRQTLFEIEREREKERLDMKRRIEQLKRTTEEETEEAKKKVTELQCDLLELRDAHAKLRTANEKLRRDKERHDRDRDQNKLLVGSLKRAQQEDDRIITQLLETIDDLMKQSPDLFRNDAPVKPEKTLLTPTPPRRNRSSKSRSRSATPENGVNTVDAATTAARLRRLTDELRASRIAERQRRHQATARRAMSTEPRDTLSVTPASRTPSRAPSLKKRSISLEQTTKDQSLIWKSVDESSVSSMQSLDGDADNRLFTMQRDASLDSRLSGGSAQSEVLPSEKKKKKSIFGKLKKLTKSRSIDDQVDSTEHVEFRPIGTVSQQGSDSDMSAAGSKRDLRGRLSDMFSRKGAMSRTNSKELSPERPASAMGSMTSSSRPPLRNASSSTLARASPAKPNEVPRPASATPAAKRKGK
ncbi:centromere-associated protein E isoform X5 [Spodoptera frugiperda]|uniref:Centromere-associated protein E isoform X5 n=1 Tax=Spodoptera frugiperda TaxID=7108 RepID=A0A9R0DX88_SPOFR|nr:centromere-associated protein E isoform X5 [Spodoptera frugiperda]